MRTIRLSDIKIQRKKQSKKQNIKREHTSKLEDCAAKTSETVLCACFGKIHVLHATCINCGKL